MAKRIRNASITVLLVGAILGVWWLLSDNPQKRFDRQYQRPLFDTLEA